MAKKRQAELTKEDKINKEIKELSKIYEKIPIGTKRTIDQLIVNAAFMSVTLNELQSSINKNGCIEEYQNGANQKGIKKSSEIDIYNTMIQRYTSIVKQLTDLLPDNKQDNISNAGEKLAAFVAKGKPGGGT